MKSRPGEKIKLISVDEMLKVPKGEPIIEIKVDRIHAFEKHPFRVLDDVKMRELEESILNSGVLNPVIVRPDDKKGYEMISGHRRLFAAKSVGLDTIPAFIRPMTDDEAIIVMVDSNIQREELLPSEKAFAYKMRYEAMRKQGNRSDLTSSQNGTKLQKKKNVSQNGIKLRADEELANQVGESRNQVHRYIRLTELIPELLEMTDQGRVALLTAVDISYLDEKLQKWVYEYIKENGIVKSYQIAAVRQFLDTYHEDLKKNQLIQILNEHQPIRQPAMKLSFTSNQLRKYFPAYYTSEEAKAVIEKLLKQWKKEQEGK
jgi:ParB family chromosome partitioning protein